MLHVKLVVNSGDNYYPEEYMLNTHVMASHNVTPAGPARVIDIIPEETRMNASKRICVEHVEDKISVASNTDTSSVGIIATMLALPMFPANLHHASTHPMMQAQMQHTLLQQQAHQIHQHQIHQHQMHRHQMQQQQMHQHQMHLHLMHSPPVNQPQPTAPPQTQKVATAGDAKLQARVVKITDTPPAKPPNQEDGVA
eukprot:11116554-Ditylum_brightwellii.AAC.1